MLAAPLLLLALAGAPADVAHLPEEELVRSALQYLDSAGVYRVTVTKEERIGKKLVGPQVLDMVLREKPYAVRIDVLDGPAKGRRALYNRELRADALRVRDAGLAGALGALWIKTESSLTRDDTNHPMYHLGLRHILEVSVEDLAKAKPYGGRKRTDEGLDAKGRYCIRSEAPPQVADSSYARSSRTCLDPVTKLPLLVEVYDAVGLLERYSYADFKPHQPVGDDYFTPESAGL
jgi:hypothetical protein